MQSIKIASLPVFYLLLVLCLVGAFVFEVLMASALKANRAAGRGLPVAPVQAA